MYKNNIAAVKEENEISIWFRIESEVKEVAFYLHVYRSFGWTLF